MWKIVTGGSACGGSGSWHPLLFRGDFYKYIYNYALRPAPALVYFLLSLGREVGPTRGYHSKSLLTAPIHCIIPMPPCQ